MSRLRAIVSQARTGTALQKEQAYSLLQKAVADETKRHQIEMKRLDLLEKKVFKLPAKLISPLAPPSDKHEPIAVFDGDGVQVYWELDDELTEFEKWPFSEDYVFTEDLESLGFQVVVA